MTTKRITLAPPKTTLDPDTQQQLQQQLTLQTQSNQNLQLVLNSILNKRQKRPIPAFLNKLYNMVSDEKTDQYIHWSLSGTSFLVPNQDEFSKEVLPRFFKHNNFTSFIRQLNMYGFHKIPSVQQGSLLSTEPEILEFSNEFFIKDRPELLTNVVRRKNVQQEEQQREVKEDYAALMLELSQIKRQQLSISTEIAKMQRENTALWQQSLQLQQQYDKQKDTIERILSFLASVFHKKKKLNGTATKKRRLILEDPDSEVDVDEHQIMNLLSGQSTVNQNDSFLPVFENPNPPVDTLGQNDALVLANPTETVVPKLEEIADPPIIDPNFNALASQAHLLSEDIDLLQDRIYGIGSLVGVDDTNALWNNPNGGEALMELINTSDSNQEELKHKTEDDFDFDEFFNQ